MYKSNEIIVRYIRERRWHLLRLSYTCTPKLVYECIQTGEIKWVDPREDGNTGNDEDEISRKLFYIIFLLKIVIGL